MRNAETVLGIIRERGSRGLPLEDVYRQLYNSELYLAAYGRIYRNKGAMTPGVTPETVDGMAQAKIERIIEQLRYERYRWDPVKRVYIEKKNSNKRRPLGMPTWTDKLLQEAIRMILDAYYEPQFSAQSHGFRPQKGCHTALTEIQHMWVGTTWFIEGDISQCFDKLDHTVLMQTLAETIHDNRFLRLINGALKAGYLEGWKWNATYSGSPQGGIMSPILANIYLDRLDKFVEQSLIPEYNRGKRRGSTPEYQHQNYLQRKLRSKGLDGEAWEVRRRMKTMTTQNAQDPNFRRLRYVRYADDFLLGFIGPKSEAEEIKGRIGGFLRDCLKLELSEQKTLVTHARTEAANFLGYEVSIYQADQKRTNGKRSINGNVCLRVPHKVIMEKCKPYMKNGKPIHRPERLHDEVYSIVERYQSEYRGVVNYYAVAVNRTQFDRLKWAMEVSLTKTLAHKLKISVPQVYDKYGTQVETPYGPMKALQVKVEREGKQPLVATWGGISLRWQRKALLEDRITHTWNARTEVVERMLADECELCGSHEGCSVHHIRNLARLQKQGRREKPEWVKIMIARQRKSLIVCQSCHEAIHAPERARKMRAWNKQNQTRNAGTGEPGDAKVSSPVRRGADGKVLQGTLPTSTQVKAAEI